MRRIFPVIAAMAAVFSVSAKMNIGEKVSSFPSPVWLDGKNRAMTDFLKSKNVSVLYFWQADQHSLSDFPRISVIAEKFREKVGFAGIARGSAEKLKRFPGSMRLGFPVNADEKDVVRETWGVKNSALPQVWVVDRNGTLLWRGRTFQLSGVLNNCLDDKFNLQEEIRKDRFTQAVNAAVKGGEFEKALGLLHQEWLKNPAGLELLEAQVALLIRRLKRPEDAFKLLHQAQQKNPGAPRFFELEYKLLADPAHKARLTDFFQRVMREFTGNPGLLMAYAVAEMGRPAEHLDMKRVLTLAGAGWHSQSFRNNVEKGKIALEYAKIVYAVGRIDLACLLAGEAYKLFEGDAKLQQGAKDAVLYYGKMKVAAMSLKASDLQK